MTTTRPYSFSPAPMVRVYPVRGPHKSRNGRWYWQARQSIPGTRKHRSVWTGWATEREAWDRWEHEPRPDAPAGNGRRPRGTRDSLTELRPGLWLDAETGGHIEKPTTLHPRRGFTIRPVRGPRMDGAPVWYWQAMEYRSEARRRVTLWTGWASCAEVLDRFGLPSDYGTPGGIKAEHPRHYREPGVYLVEGAGRLKIGVTTNVRSRMTSLRGSSPVPLDLLAHINGGRTLEAHLHERFRAHRLHGEWFEDRPEIRAAFGLQ
jgi:hypothetical protein